MIILANFSLMNMIDLLALIPFYATLIVDQMADYQMIGKTGKIIRLIRVLRIMRIFRLVRHFAGLQSLVMTMQEAYQELGLLLLIVTFAAFIFSILVYRYFRYRISRYRKFWRNTDTNKVHSTNISRIKIIYIYIYIYQEDI